MQIAIAHHQTAVIDSLRLACAAYPHWTVIWEAQSGAEVIQKCAVNIPDVLIIDLYLPDINGLQVIYHVMNHFPCAIFLIVKDLKQDTALIFEAMEYGILDVVYQAPYFEEQVIKKVNELSPLIPQARQINQIKENTNTRKVQRKFSKARIIPPLLIMGASIGGPKALAKILSFLPLDFPIAVVIIQHINEQFSEYLANWLTEQSVYPVKMITKPIRPVPGEVLLAARDQPLIMNQEGELMYVSDADETVYKPSIDVFFKSVARHWPLKSVAVLLTGMGKDGAQGLKELKKAGWHTIVQNVEDRTLSGMPQAAIELNAASEVLKLEEIASAIVTRLYSFY